MSVGLEQKCSASGHVEGKPLPPGQIIKAQRKALKITIPQLLERSRIDHAESWFYNLEGTRKSAPDMEDLAPICRVLGLDPVSAALGHLVTTGEVEG